MNLCLASVAPTLFTLLEAKLGPSTLQNYDGIVRNSPLATGLSLMWRAVLVLMLALPILLSVAYKAFLGGESTIQINSADYISNTSFYGFWRPPSMETESFNIGPTLLTNATLPFRIATTPGLDGVEPPLPNFPQPYGQNVLLLNNESTALLDTLQTDYLGAVQNLLHLDVESCKNAIEDPHTWDFTSVPLFNQWTISLLNQGRDHSNQTIQYVGLAPWYYTGCEELPPYVQRYNVERWQCQGTWRITRAGFDLVSGSCEGGKLPWTKQQILESNQLALGNWYMPSLIEAVGGFCGDLIQGNQSSWVVPTTATAVVTMVWSKVVALDGFSWFPFDSSEFNMSSPSWELRNKSRISDLPTYADLLTQTYLRRPTYVDLLTQTYLRRLTYADLPTQTYLRRPTYEDLRVRAGKWSRDLRKLTYENLRKPTYKDLRRPTYKDLPTYEDLPTYKDLPTYADLPTKTYL
ncbi:hypothetical protein CHU98_g10337 [Xylaria longipes]|nr:hypothetical protein CHU98_g10337 [Xylaria longipes]